MHRLGWWMAAVAVVVGLGAAACAGEAKPKGAKNSLLAARGQISRVDKTAKTFVVSNKKKGDTTVQWDAKTVFKKGGADRTAAPTAGTVDDLKDGMVAQVTGKLEGNKVLATQVVVGAKKKKSAGL